MHKIQPLNATSHVESIINVIVIEKKIERKMPAEKLPKDFDHIVWVCVFADDLWMDEPNVRVSVCVSVTH